MSPRDIQFKPCPDKQEAQDRREWMKQASRPDLVEAMNKDLEKVWQRFEEAKRWRSEVDYEGGVQ